MGYARRADQGRRRPAAPHRGLLPPTSGAETTLGRDLRDAGGCRLGVKSSRGAAGLKAGSATRARGRQTFERYINATPGSPTT